MNDGTGLLLETSNIITESEAQYDLTVGEVDLSSAFDSARIYYGRAFGYSNSNINDGLGIFWNPVWQEDISRASKNAVKEAQFASQTLRTVVTPMLPSLEQEISKYI
ncbi:hypothetical protein FRB91_011325 [Serendipita sp. 411]|nr:hypothetical protein FRC15_002705 [Serendipita sp. 397]KAG8827231.1 hypothetical protein FRC19_004750 [Serendipita sp. 401]KAG8847914.1 hypothetical protein FRB91_011325 [Serendipita sp. 411]KAG8869311.1 hypothetical protein FRC20_001700 [Serendipita sp. 405]